MQCSVTEALTMVSKYMNQSKAHLWFYIPDSQYQFLFANLLKRCYQLNAMLYRTERMMLDETNGCNSVLVYYAEQLLTSDHSVKLLTEQHSKVFFLCTSYRPQRLPECILPVWVNSMDLQETCDYFYDKYPIQSITTAFHICSPYYVSLSLIERLLEDGILSLDAMMRILSPDEDTTLRAMEALPLVAQQLIIAAFVCSRIPPSMDMSYFGTGKRARGRPSSKIENKIDLERILSAFDGIFITERVSDDILRQNIVALVDLGVLKKIGHKATLKYTVLASEQQIRTIAYQLNIDIERFINTEYS